MTRQFGFRRRLAYVLAACLLASACWCSYARFSSSRSSYYDLLAERRESTTLIRQIHALRAKPDRAAAQSRSDRSLAELIETAAASVGVGREQVARIEPQSPRRAGDSDYLDHSTVVQFDSVTLKQLADGLAAIRDPKTGIADLQVAAMRVTAPYQAGDASGPEKWNIELTLTYFVYSPKTLPARKS